MDLKRLIEMLRDKGCKRAFFKVLAANDNSKNQIYLGGDFTAAGLIPHNNIRQHRTGDITQTGRTSKEIFKADVDFTWLNDRGDRFQAPSAQMIMYPQYPEVRISSLLKDCAGAPTELIRTREQGRILFFGICQDGRVIGYITAHDSALAKEISDCRGLKEIGVFRELPLTGREDSRTTLLKELGRIYQKGWIYGQRITRDGVVEYNAPNAGGYTLEAELGIYPNAYAEPDYLGWEIKQHKVTSFDKPEVGVITLMTPEPMEGYYRDQGVEAFVRKYGARDKMGRPDRLNFGGVHHCNQRVGRTGLTLVLHGYDPESNRILDISGGICLVSDDLEIAAKWPFTGIIDHWSRKHALAAYVPARSRKEGAGPQYWFGPRVRLGEGTDVLLLLKAVSNGSVYYDPGIKLENASTARPHSKRRSQFRIHSRHVPALYRQMHLQNVII